MIKSFTDLLAWQKAHQLAVEIYKTTKTFPKEELFGLTSQIRRASISVPSNIAEGFSRASKKEKQQFYRIALGSLTETQSQLLMAKDIEILDPKKMKELAEKSVRVSKLLNGLIKHLNT